MDDLTHLNGQDMEKSVYDTPRSFGMTEPITGEQHCRTSHPSQRQYLQHSVGLFE
jgi:hypothetical protein